jgi:hypothetical protein
MNRLCRGDTRQLLRRLAYRALALILCGSSVLGASAQDGPSPISFTVRCQNAQQLTFTIQNVGLEDTALIFGSVLANGRKYLIAGLKLQTELPDGREDQYDYRPDDYPVRIGGRVDDWIVPLPTGASYVMQATASQFLSKAHGRLSAWPKAAQISLRLPIRTPNPNQPTDVVGLKLFRVWRGTDALISNRITVPSECS